jgi:ribonuclease HII
MRRMTIIKLGIDEAGKGPVIGPMCVAGACVTEAQEKKLKILGVDDSKKLTAKKREHANVFIKKYAEAYYIYEIEARQIDDLRKIMTMNDIMVLCFSKVMEEMSSKITFDTVVLDSIDVIEERFARRVKEEYAKKFPIEAEKIEFISKHKADAISIAVSAASILAKVRRDERIELIKKKEGIDFGTGYPADPKTKQFLEKCAAEKRDFPDYVRKSWKTAENLL